MEEICISILKSAIQFLLSGNFGAILVVLCASVAGLPVPFAPVHLLFINLLTDSLPAIALGVEPHSKAVMEQRPRPMSESILTKPYLLSIATEGVSIGVMTMAAFLIGYTSQNAALASTMAFGTLCMSRLVHGFNCKDDKPVIFTKRFFNNKYLIGAFCPGYDPDHKCSYDSGTARNVQSSYVEPEAADDSIRACIVESSCDPGNEIFEREIETENGIEKRNGKTDQGD